MATKATDPVVPPDAVRAWVPAQFTFRSPVEACAALRADPDVSAAPGAQRPNGAAWLIFCPSRRLLPGGNPVRVMVRLGERRPPIELRGRVVAIEASDRARPRRRGLVVRVDEGSLAQLEFVRHAATLLAPRRRRRHDRLAVDLPVRFRFEGSQRVLPGTVRDIGWGGAFVSTGYPVDPDAPVVVELQAPGLQSSVDLAGRVVWTGQRQAARGFGLAWRARDAGGNRRIRELVRRLLGAASAGA